MGKIGYVVPVVNYKFQRKSRCIPDQSLSIQEIVKRYVRGVPVDVIQRQPVYVDQYDDDLEKLSRLDFGQKSEYAEHMAERAAGLRDELAELKRKTTILEEERAAAKLAKEAVAQAAPKPA